LLKIKLLRGNLLENWSTDIVKDISEICYILVCLDDKETAVIARKAGSTVPRLRITELSSISSKSVAVSIYALNRYQLKNSSIDGLPLLQPDSHFCTTFRIKILKSGSFKSVLGTLSCHKKQYGILQKDNEFLESFLKYIFPFNHLSKVGKENYELYKNLHLASQADVIPSKSLIYKIFGPHHQTRR
jgi:hypothetical protein